MKLKGLFGGFLALAILAGCDCDPSPAGAPANSIMVLAPYRHAGTRVFDDARAGLVKEAFVAGIPEIPDADRGFRLLFAAEEFPAKTEPK